MYKYIKNPINNKKVNVNSKLGKKILKNYLYILKGGVNTNLSEVNETVPDLLSRRAMSVDEAAAMEADTSSSRQHILEKNFKYNFPTFVPASFTCFGHSDTTKEFLHLINLLLLKNNITNNNTQLFQVILIKNGYSYMAYLDNVHHSLTSIDPNTREIIQSNYFKVPWLSINNNAIMDKFILEYIAQYLFKVTEILNTKPDGYQFLLQFHYQKGRGEGGEGGLFHKDDSQELKSSFVSLSFVNNECIHGTEIVSCEQLGADFGMTKKCEILRPLMRRHATLVFTNRTTYHSSPTSSSSDRRLQSQDLAISTDGFLLPFNHDIVTTHYTCLQNVDIKRPPFLRVWLSEQEYFTPFEQSNAGIFIGELILESSEQILIITNPRPGMTQEKHYVHNIHTPNITLNEIPQMGGMNK